MNNLKVIKLVAENIKGLKAIEISPDPYFQQISGRNEQGKSSVIDSIWLAIGGSEALKGTRTDRPIRNGEEEAMIKLDLGEIVVTRKFKGDKSSLTVQSATGSKFGSPQTMLDSLIGKISFDPLSFISMDDDKQVKTLQNLIGFDPSELDKKRNDLFNQRTIVNREVKTLEGQLAGLSKPPDDTPIEEVSASEILKELRAAEAIKTSNDEKREKLVKIRNERFRISAELSGIDDEIKKLEQQIFDLKNKKETYQMNIKSLSESEFEMQTEINQLEDPDLFTFQERLEQVDKTNQLVRDARTYRDKHGQLVEKSNESEKLTKEIASIDLQKEKAIKAAKLPIEGLGFNETGVTYNGVPLKQCSDAQQIKVSMSIAMDLNPKLRVIRIKNGSLLDKTNMQLIADLAKDKDYQVWIEVVDDSGTVGVYVEDGEIKSLGKQVAE